jgi:hypothetical protein
VLRREALCIIATLYLDGELQSLGGEACGDGGAHALGELPHVGDFCGEKVFEELAGGAGGDEDVAGNMRQVSQTGEGVAGVTDRGGGWGDARGIGCVQRGEG